MIGRSVSLDLVDGCDQLPLVAVGGGGEVATGEGVGGEGDALAGPCPIGRPGHDDGHVVLSCQCADDNGRDRL